MKIVVFDKRYFPNWGLYGIIRWFNNEEHTYDKKDIWERAIKSHIK